MLDNKDYELANKELLLAQEQNALVEKENKLITALKQEYTTTSTITTNTIANINEWESILK